MRKLTMAVLAAAVSLYACPAGASTVLTGTFEPNNVFGALILTIFNNGAVGSNFLGENAFVDLGPGRYDITFSATADVHGLNLGEAVNQFSHLDVVGMFPGSYDFDGAILNKQAPGAAGDEYHAGDLITDSLVIPSNTSNVDVESVGTFTTTNTFNGVVAVNGVSDFSGGWTLTVTAVPEPATWAMMLVGFGLSGAILRRRRTAVPG